MVGFEYPGAFHGRKCAKEFIAALKEYGIEYLDLIDKKIEDPKFPDKNILIWTDKATKFKGMYRIVLQNNFADPDHQWINNVHAPEGETIPNVSECSHDDIQQLQVNVGKLLKKDIKIIMFNWYYFDHMNCMRELFEKLLLDKKIKIVFTRSKSFSIDQGMDETDIEKILHIDVSQLNAIFGETDNINAYTRYWDGKLTKGAYQSGSKYVKDLSEHIRWLLEMIKGNEKPNNVLLMSNTVDCQIGLNKGMKCIDLEKNDDKILKWSQNDLIEYVETGNVNTDDEQQNSNSRGFTQQISIGVIFVLLVLFFI